LEGGRGEEAASDALPGATAAVFADLAFAGANNNDEDGEGGEEEGER
jgi:hypothetical protein